MRQNEVHVPDLKSGPSFSALKQSGAAFDVQVWIRCGHGPGGVRSHVVGVILALIEIVHAYYIVLFARIQPNLSRFSASLATSDLSSTRDYGLQEL